jgi:hypothetical protein
MAEALDVQGIHIPVKVIASFVVVGSVTISTIAAAIANAVQLHHHHYHHHHSHHHHRHKNNHHQNPSTSENIRNPLKSTPSQ